MRGMDNSRRTDLLMRLAAHSVMLVRSTKRTSDGTTDQLLVGKLQLFRSDSKSQIRTLEDSQIF